MSTEFNSTPWPIHLLGEVSEITLGGTPSTDVADYWGGGIPWMTSGEVNKRHVFEVDERITEIGLASSNATLVEPPAVAIGLAGQGKTRGTAALVHIRVSTNQSIALIKGKSQSLHTTYLFHNLDHRYEELRSRSAGGGRAGLSREILQRVPIALPDPPEQSRIAAVLDTVDEAIAKTEAVIAKLKQVRAGLLHDLLTRGLDENGQLRDPIAHPEQFQDSPIGRIPRGWDVKEIKDCYEVPSRNGIYKNASFYGSGYRMVHMPQMFKGIVIDISDAMRVAVDPQELQRYALKEGDLLFARRSLNLEGAGLCSMVQNLEEPVTFESSIVRVRVKKDWIIPGFATEFLRSPYGYLLRRPFIRQVAVSGVSSEDIGHFVLPCPNSEEQERILAFLEPYDRMLRLFEFEMSKLSLLKSALMADLLTGRVRAPADLEFG